MFFQNPQTVRILYEKLIRGGIRDYEMAKKHWSRTVGFAHGHRTKYI